MSYKVIVAHPGKQHSIKTAEILKEKGFLLKYITTVYDKQQSFTQTVRLLLKGKNKRKALSRRSSVLEDKDVAQFYELWGLLFLLWSRLRFISKFFPGYSNKLFDKFGEKVAGYAIKHNADAVIMFDTNSNSCFRILKEKAPHIKRILDVSIASRIFLKKEYEKDGSLYEDSCILREQRFAISEKMLTRAKEEFENSQYFFAGSEFVKKSLIYSGVEDLKIYVIPYGVNLKQFESKPLEFVEKPIKLLFMGGLLYRKGIHHLLDVVSQYKKDEIELYLAGQYNRDSEIYKRYKNFQNIHFLGFITKDNIVSTYQECDVFVLPSIAEGFALVSLEAMGCGLPVICTENSGCNDAVIDYKNGFVLKTSDREALKKCIDWLLLNTEKIPLMQKNAEEIVQNYTWDHYCGKLYDAIKQIIVE